jgi:uncharacterized membrane protein
LDSQTPIVYQINEDSNSLKVTWYYSANNQVKRFLIEYEIEGAINRYQDVVEFYWKIIEDKHEFIKNFHGEVNLPESSPDLFKVFIHTTAQPGTLTFSDDLKKATVELKDVPKDSFVEFRVLTSPSIFSGISQIQTKKYEAILNEEKRILKLNQFQFFTHSLKFIAIVVIIPIIIFFYFYFKYGREPKVDYQLKYETEPPRDVPPMFLAVLYKKDTATSPKGLIATILDLARRGYMEIREQKRDQLFGLMKNTEQIFTITKKGRKELASETSLLDFERNILKLLFVNMTSKDEISSSEIKKWGQKNRYGILKEISKLKKDAESWFKKTYFDIYEPRSLKTAFKFLGFFALYAIIIFAFLFFTNINFPANLITIFIILTLVFIPLGFFAFWAIRNKTPESTLEMKRWNAFKRYITDFSAMKDAPLTLLYIWDRYLIYAVVLGVANKLLDNIKNLSLERHVSVAAVSWYHPIGSPGVPKGMMSPESFSSFSSNMSSMINALSSSSSVGGGFSGGGGGGGGGGGSGAG